MTQDYREVRDIELDELVRRARGGTLRHVSGGPVIELRRWRAYLIGQAEDLVRASASENRGLQQNQDRAVGEFIAGAGELHALIQELEAAYRKELADPGNLVPISPKYV
jgi:hypothetical protein